MIRRRAARPVPGDGRAIGNADPWLVAALRRLILDYQTYLGRREQRRPGFSSHGLDALARVFGVRNAMQGGCEDIPVVPILRHSCSGGSGPPAAPLHRWTWSSRDT